MYRIATLIDGQWDIDACGRDGNEFDSLQEARDAIISLIKLGDEWADASYAILDGEEELVETAVVETRTI